MTLCFRPACAADVPAIVSLYKASLGLPGCTWDEEYPSEETAMLDLAAGCLYAAESGGAVIGAVSVIPENELDDCTFWQIADGSRREIARVVIAPAHRGHGYAAVMLQALFDRLQNDGCRAVHLLAATCNPAAVATYRRLGFETRGRYHAYGFDYFAMEKIL